MGDRHFCQRQGGRSGAPGERPDDDLSTYRARSSSVAWALLAPSSRSGQATLNASSRPPSGSFRLSCSDAHPSELASLEPSSASSSAVSASEPAVLRQSSFRREASNLRSTRSGAGGAFSSGTVVRRFLLRADRGFESSPSARAQTPSRHRVDVAMRPSDGSYRSRANACERSVGSDRSRECSCSQ